MIKILLKNTGPNSSKRFQQTVAQMLRATIMVRSSITSDIEMYSVRELYTKDHNSQSMNRSTDSHKSSE